MSRNPIPLGATRVTAGKVYRKVAEKKRPRNWQAEHRRLWEMKYGPIPYGHRLHCKDGNWANLSMDNFFLVSLKQRGETYKNYWPKELIDVMRVHGQLKQRLLREAADAEESSD